MKGGAAGLPLAFFWYLCGRISWVSGGGTCGDRATGRQRGDDGAGSVGNAGVSTGLPVSVRGLLESIRTEVGLRRLLTFHL